jgi:hypothetical protein
MVKDIGDWSDNWMLRPAADDPRIDEDDVSEAGILRVPEHLDAAVLIDVTSGGRWFVSIQILETAIGTGESRYRDSNTYRSFPAIRAEAEKKANAYRDKIETTTDISQLG